MWMTEEAKGSDGPRIVAFLCNWCSNEAADNAGTRRLAYPAEVVPIRVMCSAMVDAQFILHSLQKGADGVLIGGCHYGDCHYQTGNYKTFRRVELIKTLLGQLGIDPGRVRFENISAAEGDKFAKVVSSFISEIEAMGQNPMRRAVSGGGGGD
jgi:F420-non-reducing hydrogenase iron-sulfur subunit